MVNSNQSIMCSDFESRLEKILIVKIIKFFGFDLRRFYKICSHNFMIFDVIEY